jgi:hypothetical protein
MGRNSVFLCSAECGQVVAMVFGDELVCLTQMKWNRLHASIFGGADSFSAWTIFLPVKPLGHSGKRSDQECNGTVTEKDDECAQRTTANRQEELVASTLN